MYKVEIQVFGDPKWYSNGKQYETEEEAKTAGLSLFTRWTQCENWRIAKVETGNSLSDES